MKITDKHGQQWQLVPTTENAWMLDDENINELQVSSIYTVINRCRHAHFTNIKIRINGAWEEFEADWIKHIKPIAAAPEPELSGELETVAYISAGGDVSRSKKYFDELGFISEALVLRSQAEAIIAKKDAEIAQGIQGLHHYRQNNVQLRQELAEISAALDDARSDLTMTMPEIIKELREQVQRQASLIEQFHFAIESMRVAGGHVEFQAAFDKAKELLHG